MRRTLHGPTTTSPVVTRFFCPPLMPRRVWLPTIVSAQTCNRVIDGDEGAHIRGDKHDAEGVTQRQHASEHRAELASLAHAQRALVQGDTLQS